MANEKVNKVLLGNEVLIDLTDSTVNPNVLLAGYKAYDASGNAITGEFSPSYHITLTQAQYDQLSQTEKMADENFFYITDAVVVGADIDDTTTSTTKVWSSSKTNTELSAKANSADVPTKAQITNPNLLDNPWFTVNQRGASSYTGNGIYGLDRWVNSGSQTVSINNDGTISITSSSGETQLQNRIENSDFLTGKTVTLSILYADGVVESLTGQASTTTTLVKTLRNNSSQMILYYRSVGHYAFIIKTMAGTNTENIRAVKLEIGSISTLALDTAPNYATELLKCQRYFNSMSFAQYQTISHVDASSNFMQIYLPCPKMRTNPAISISGTLGYITTNNEDIAPQAFNVVDGYFGGYTKGGTRGVVGVASSGYAYTNDSNGVTISLTADL